ncbi:sulfoxide reductase heme-binding subunit YedZ [Ideonella sp. 4Y16]|uniref:Protein-methionine-sulfoxide reductase heme-binding subunit MsrQ n=1 Tax=Ideonella alba TaxID=2824118 RepID=A0A941BCV3_9BURK|nr:protein-methionine-sulfoxide reductase heme-binding subunit MsrQ [Ideonella alba]MBQ0932325.1 sulfoxide reductase heme-binding subunit YedZ [Ideonella alba]MBQ0944475.1 sulfoxide reductase heme-binding subunit YedZ [Ideonella alba]
MNRWLLHPLAKPVVWLLLGLPAASLVWAALYGGLGPNPAEALIRSLGDWTLRGLCLTLAITPLRQLTGWSGLARFRRNVGVATFVYATLHWSAYAWLDMEWALDALLKDIGKRPFILVGTAAWLALLPLAATSFNAAVRWMGGRAWRDLHKLTYVIGPVALLHFWWMRAGKNNLLEPAIYALVIGGLLAARRWRA